MMTVPHQEITHDLVGRLIKACRAGESLFRDASRSMSDPMLRAELIQYSTQRQEFVGELEEASPHVGDQLCGESSPADRHRRNAVTMAFADHDAALVLAECEREEASALEAYRQAVAAALPIQISGLIYAQFAAVSRVHDRIQRLAASALEPVRE